MKESKSFELIIQSDKKMRTYWRELWHFRELFLFLAWRDILIRYKQTVIGVAWAVIRPFLTMVVLTVIFSNIANLPSVGGVPYPILVYAGLLPWFLFSNSFSDASSSFLNNTNLLTKIYFPRIIIPASTIIVNLVDFLLSFGIFIGLMVWFQYVPSLAIFTLPLFILLAMVLAMGAGVLIAAINVKYRDFKYIVPFIVQFGLYISPVGFNSNIIPQELRLIFSFNPLVGLIDGFRWAILGSEFDPLSLLLSVIISFVLLLIGLWYFNKTEQTFADII